MNQNYRPPWTVIKQRTKKKIEVKSLVYNRWQTIKSKQNRNIATFQHEIEDQIAFVGKNGNHP